MKFSQRQEEIIRIVKKKQPITADAIADHFQLTKSTLRSDLAVLTMVGILDAKPKIGYFYTGQNVEPLWSDQFADLTVADVMGSAIQVSPDSSVQEAITLLFLYDSGSLYVSLPEDQELLGIVSRKDLLRASLSGGDQGQTALAVIMTRMPNILVTRADTPLIEAAKILVKHEVDSLPVVEDLEHFKILGKLSKTHLVRLFVQSLVSEEDL
ncbi:CBS domain-containing protein [Aerococcus sanguinicola]|uniref:CBS domain-containing protein n=1 Tax=unclassified Aerococcus TaxID=2618060 RepID=UPI0008A34E4B|nr:MULTISPECIES: helix-turn-helix transcriptional regulator [unclassified Aerococcus]MDK6232882.1 helix-turn-helix transcriptional regulator [Aerococcus sp. UMB10185]MDK6855772.1 helix-turn-helix transcriptional regulator [Aerococcus sp. UMB7533]OFN03043.1 transcriptional repressor CcpN [Aerococcus sp. HMSC062A02]OHO45281.1 transcriptional repressor CcpN [Aerococcus sp. HMSC035B07]